MIKEYEFPNDIKDFQIFPEAVTSISNVVYHGTCEYHSDNIEKNGFVLRTSAFDFDQAKDLLNLLEMKEIDACDECDNPLNMKQAFFIKHYIDNIQKNIRLSFSRYSLYCIEYAFGESKGGFGKVRKAKRIIDKAISKNNEIVIPATVTELFKILNIVDNSKGIIYAIDLGGLIENNNESDVVYYEKNIPATSIIGKMILPNDFREINFPILEPKHNTNWYNFVKSLNFNTANEKKS